MCLKNGVYILEIKKCSYCHKILENGDKVTLVIPDLSVVGKYRKNHEGYRIDIPHDFASLKTNKVYCNDCLDINKYFLEN